MTEWTRSYFHSHSQEKRRVQEEQERAKRELEDERIRLQQLKRKSLRDQWLMEGPPLSPSSLDPPRSPLWGTQAQEIEKHIDKLESKTQHLAEAEEKLKEVMEYDFGTESPQADEVIFTNGVGEMEEDISHVASVEALPAINGLREETKSVQVVNTDDNDEDGTMVIRAECIMIVDESDEAAEEPTEENVCPVINPTLIPEETQQTVTESVQSEGTVTTSVEAGLPESAVIPNGVGEDELERETAAQLLSQTEEAAVVAPVPVYTETKPYITTSSQVEVKNEDTNEEERIEVVSKAKGNVTVEFQEVPLSEPLDKKAPGEQEPLLSGIKAKDAEPATSNDQTKTPDRADQETKMPKRKTCQCCSVM
uniref:Paralemmin n=1 Tax=Neogobius melanostomus TaxID=47308 RepID=A0A8C6TA28_9GOBI